METWKDPFTNKALSFDNEFCDMSEACKRGRDRDRDRGRDRGRARWQAIIEEHQRLAALPEMQERFRNRQIQQEEEELQERRLQLYQNGVDLIMGIIFTILGIAGQSARNIIRNFVEFLRFLYGLGYQGGLTLAAVIYIQLLRETRHQEEVELRNEPQQDNSIEGIQYILLFYYYIYINNFILISKKIVPNFLRKTQVSYVVLGGKAFQLYFKDIKSDDWDIVIESNPKLFLSALEKELHNHGIRDLEYAVATDPHEEKVYQLGLTSYNGPDYEERFFIDIKKGKVNKYGPIKLNGINVASLEYLYKDGKDTLSDRQSNFKDSKKSFVNNTRIHSEIDYNNTKIKSDIIDNYKLIVNFYEKKLPNFKEGSVLKTSLEAYLKKFIDYYKNNPEVIKKNKDLEDTYDELYDDKLEKYYINVNEETLTPTGKNRDLYELIHARELFMKQRGDYKNRSSNIKLHRELLKTQTTLTDRNKIKYLKSFRRNQAFMNIIKHLDLDVFTRHFIGYMKKNCKNNKFSLVLDNPKVIKLPCNKKTLTKTRNLSTLKKSVSTSKSKSKSNRKYKTI